MMLPNGRKKVPDLKEKATQFSGLVLAAWFVLDLATGVPANDMSQESDFG